MIHTFELRYLKKRKSIRRIANMLLDNPELLDTIGHASYQWHDDYPGLHEIIFRNSGDEYCDVGLIVEPEALIQGKYTIELFDPSPASISTLHTAFARAISETAGRSLPDNMNEWRTARIDYAMNLHCTPVERYVELAKRGRDPYRYKEKVNREGSSYRECKSTRLNFYNKADQINKAYNHMPDVQLELLQDAEGVFRIEVQCREYSKLKNIKDKYGLLDMSITSFLNRDVASQVIRDYYGKVVGFGDYYSLAKAKKRIDRTSWQRNKKTNIYNWLRLIAQVRKISEARHKYVNGAQLKNTQTTVQGSLATFNNYVKGCREIGLNPVTIPRKWGISHLPNPFLNT